MLRKTVSIVATGSVNRLLQKYPQTMVGKHPVDSLQKKKNSCTRDTAQNKVLYSATGSLSCGVHHYFKRRNTRVKGTCDKR
jgi:hypothetical protein